MDNIKKVLKMKKKGFVALALAATVMTANAQNVYDGNKT